PGAVLLGDEGGCFECGHEHATGDRCLAFHFTPDHLEAIVAAVPGARPTMFAIPALPPLSSLMPLLAAAEAARDDGDNGEFEELALRLAGAIAAALAGTRRLANRPSRRDERRVTDALRQIEARSPEQLTLTETGARGGDESVPFLAHLSRRGGHDALSIRAAHASPPRCLGFAPLERADLDHRF